MSVIILTPPETPVPAVDELLTDRMAQIIRQAGKHVVPIYGAEVEAENLDDIEQGETKAFINAREDSSGAIPQASGGTIIAGDIKLDVFGVGDNGDIEVIRATKGIVALGFTNEFGRFGQHFQAPFFFGGAEFLQFQPLGKVFDEMVSFEGKHWHKQQIIEFEMRQPGV
ncbi:hypothetical protein LCGC14_0773780 [marine sediment metagenome]|uniref:Uncharacterized protein n=1 Tax=marine sediment metagenome TaxID=412755 RepID=A0A0F9SHJ7_9ZZZZ